MPRATRCPNCHEMTLDDRPCPGCGHDVAESLQRTSDQTKRAEGQTALGLAVLAILLLGGLASLAFYNQRVGGIAMMGLGAVVAFLGPFFMGQVTLQLTTFQVGQEPSAAERRIAAIIILSGVTLFLIGGTLILLAR